MATTLENGLLTERSKLSRRQMLALKTLDEPGDRDVCYGGAKGGGKSVLGCKWVVSDSLKLIGRFGLQPGPDPVVIGFMGRKRNTDFVKTTLEIFREFNSRHLYRLNESKQEIVILDRVKWHYGGFDDRAVVEKFNSAQYCRYFIDQGEEITEREWAMLSGTMRKKFGDDETMQPDYTGLLTCNPAQCWLKREFVRNPHLKELGRAFIQALPKDNPFLAKGYVERLRHIYRNQPELIEAYIEGSWDAIEAGNQIIRELWIRKSEQLGYVRANPRRIIACDFARYGDDRTVIGYGEETDLKEVLIFGKKDAYYTINEIENLALRHSDDGTNKGAPLIVGDADGLGGPELDMLRGHGYNVMDIHSAGESSDQDFFWNLRAEMWWNAAKMYGDGDLYNSYGSMRADDIDDLRTELTVVGYTVRQGRILVDSKDDIKDPKRYGRSPDLADMYVMLLYGLQFVQPSRAESAEARQRRAYRRRLSPMAG